MNVREGHKKIWIWKYLKIFQCKYEFMKFVKYLIENKFTDIKRRDGKSILNKLKIKIKYYQLIYLLSKKEKLNRIKQIKFL